jgi:REP element-mobilizing transposase RayT
MSDNNVVTMRDFKAKENLLLLRRFLKYSVEKMFLKYSNLDSYNLKEHHVWDATYSFCSDGNN